MTACQKRDKSVPRKNTQIDAVRPKKKEEEEDEEEET